MCRVMIKRGDVTCFLLFATQASLSSQTQTHALQLISTHNDAVLNNVLSNVVHFCNSLKPHLHKEKICLNAVQCYVLQYDDDIRPG